MGGPNDNTNVGAVWIYTKSCTTWSQQGNKLVGTGAVGAAQQGFSVSLSSDGNTALVGGNRDNGNAGAVWVFTRTGTTWTQQGKLVGTGAVGAAQQGFSVSLSSDGNTALVGGCADNSNAGAVWIFTRSGTTWTQQGTKLVGTGAVGAAYQGWSVALSANGTTAMVGAFQDNAQAGAAWVYTRSGTTWTQQGTKLVGTGAVGAAQQGTSASLSSDGNTAMVGGYTDNNVGAAWVFTRSGTTWTQQGTKLVGTGTVGAAALGSSVSLSGDGNTAIIGGYNDNSFAGASWVFTRTGSTWTQQGSKLVGTGAVGTVARQGSSVSISADGRTAFIGAFDDNSNAGAAAGAAWVYSVPDATTITGTLCSGSTLTVAPTTGIQTLAWALNGNVVNTTTATYNANGITVAGNNVAGSGTNQLAYPKGVYVDVSGNVYVADQQNHRIQRWAPGAISGTTVAGGNLAGSDANQLAYPRNVYVDGSGNVYVADANNNRIQRWAPGATSGTTVAGSNLAGSGANQLDYPAGVYVDVSGNVYVADYGNDRIQRWAPGATSGTTVAGGNLAGSDANQLNGPAGVYVDGNGNVYVADLSNHRIQRWAPGAISGRTVAGGYGASSGANQLNYPTGVYVDGSGNVYVADQFNNRIQRWAPGAISGTTVASGNLIGGSSANQLNRPYGVFLDGSGNIYVADLNNNRIQRFAPAGIVNTLNNAASGTYSVTATSFAGCSATSAGVVVNATPPTPTISAGSATTFCTGGSVVLTSNSATGNQWYVDGSLINGATNPTYTATTSGTYTVVVAGANGCSSAPSTGIDVTVNPLPATPTITRTLCSGSTLTAAPTTGIQTLSWALNGNVLNTTTATWNANGTTVAGNNAAGSGTNQLDGPFGVYVDGSGNVYVADRNNHRIQRWAPGATIGTTVAGGNGQGSGANQLYNPTGVYVDVSGNVYVADVFNHRIQRWAPGATSGTTVAGGNGQGSGVNQFNYPKGVYVDGSGNVYVADRINNRIQRWAPGATSGTTVAGGNGAGSGANQLNGPFGVYVDVSGNVYVADRSNHRIQRWAPSATSGTTVAGGNGEGSGDNQLYYPYGVYVDGSGNVYVADGFNYRIQRWASGAASGTTVAGYNEYGSVENQLYSPFGVYVDGSGNVYAADNGYHRIQQFAPAIVDTLNNAAVGTYTVTATSFAGCSVTSAGLNLTVNLCTTTLNLTAFLEGFYTENGTMRANLYDLGISTNDTETDSVDVNLWSATNLSAPTPDYSVKTIIHTNGTIAAVFPGATLNNSYYVALKHRNSVEIWSAEPVTISSTSSYDFSTSLSSAYSDGFNDPLKWLNGNKYAMFSGDVNQDGTVDLFDAQITENGAANFLFGYDASDCNGDGSTDLFDLQLIDNNSTLFLFYARPY